MTDVLNPEQRHKCMSRIRSKNTKPEMLVRKFLFAHGFRYRINVKSLPGTPDIVLKKYQTVILINGCFWHGHDGCKYSVLPKTNVDFWKNKIEGNKKRDLLKYREIRNLGWHVIQLWECQLKSKVRMETLVGLEYTLNYIFLQNHGVRSYPELMIEDVQAAEEKIEYKVGNRNDKFEAVKKDEDNIGK